MQRPTILWQPLVPHTTVFDTDKKPFARLQYQHGITVALNNMLTIRNAKVRDILIQGGTPEHAPDGYKVMAHVKQQIAAWNLENEEMPPEEFYGKCRIFRMTDPDTQVEVHAVVGVDWSRKSKELRAGKQIFIICLPEESDFISTEYTSEFPK